MSDIFISYRRDDSAGHAGRLYDRLSQRFGHERVFMDIDAIPPGVDFNAEIDRVLRRCAVVLVVIGRRWMDAMGQWRQKDYLKEEIIAALGRGTSVRVVPVLVDGATLPERYRLSTELQPLLNRHAFEISNKSFAHDANKLIESIARSVKPRVQPARKAKVTHATVVKRPGAAGPESPKRRSRKGGEAPAGGHGPRPARQGPAKAEGARRKGEASPASDRRKTPGGAPAVPKPPRKEPPKPRQAADGQQKKKTKAPGSTNARAAVPAAGAKSPGGVGQGAARRGPAPRKQSKPPAQPGRARPAGGNAKSPAAKSPASKSRKKR